MKPEHFMPRLAFIRYLYSTGIEQSRQPLPMGAAALLTLHDSVEMFLQLASEHLNAGAERKTDFDKYFVLIDASLTANQQESLSGKASMMRLNNARVGLKHYGNLPALQVLEEFRSSVMGFFEDNTPLVFGMALDVISMVDLVECDTARNNLREATDLMGQGNTTEAIKKIAIAFDMLLRDYEDSKRGGRRHSPFFFGRSLGFETSFHMGVDDRKLSSFIDKVQESIQALQAAVRILSLGLDYRRYSRFQWLTPGVRHSLNGDVYTLSVRRETPTLEDCRYCFDFVIDAAIRLQDFDYEIENPIERQRLLAAQAQVPNTQEVTSEADALGTEPPSSQT